MSVCVWRGEKCTNSIKRKDFNLGKWLRVSSQHFHGAQKQERADMKQEIVDMKLEKAGKKLELNT